jgi:hypothetical protein
MMKNISEHRKVLALGGASLLLGVIFTSLFYEQWIGFNYPLFVFLITLCGVKLAYLFQRTIDKQLYVLIGLALFFAVMVFVRESILLTFFNVLGSLLLLLVVMSSLTGKHIKQFLPLDYLKVFFLPFRFILPFFSTLGDISSLRKVAGESSASKEVIRGSIMAAIAIVVFSTLFASADPVFEKILSNIFFVEIDEALLQRVILTTLVTAFFIGAFGYLFRKVHAAPGATVSIVRNLGVIETMILFGSVNLLFFAFILLQLAHLFGGVEHLVDQGLTYAEYARKGFFELVVVAVLSYLLVSVAEKQIIRKEEKHLRSFKVLSGILVLEVVLILFSAFMRLSLYEDAYGFTVIRLYSHALMIWIGVVLVLLSQHIWTNGKRELFTLRTFWTVVALLLAMNAINPDAFIAKQNLARYAGTGKIDTEYLGELSSDALPYTLRLLNDPNEQTKNNFARDLYWSRQYHYGEEGDKALKNWQSMNLSRTKAEKLLAPQRGILEAHKGDSDSPESL